MNTENKKDAVELATNLKGEARENFGIKIGANNSPITFSRKVEVEPR